VEEADRVVAPEFVVVAEEEEEPLGDGLRAGTRVSVPEAVSVIEGRRVTLPQDVAVVEGVTRLVAEVEAVPVSLGESFGLLVLLKEMRGVPVPTWQRLGVAEVVCVLLCVELRVWV